MTQREGVIFIRLGTQLLVHQGAIEAEEGAMGVYTFCVLYSRANELDGFVPRKVAERCWSGRTNVNKAFLEILCSPAVAFLARATHPTLGDGFEVLKYPEFNETKAQIASRRSDARERKRRARTPSQTPPPPPNQEVRHASVPCDSRVTHASVPVSVSVSVSDPESKEDPERLAAPPANDVPRPLGPSVGAQSAPPDDVPLDDDLKARCFAAGVRHPTKQDVQAMLNHARDKGRTSADWKAALVQWVRRKPQFEGPRSPQDASSASGRPERPPQGMSPPVPRSVPAPWSKKKEAS